MAIRDLVHSLLERPDSLLQAAAAQDEKVAMQQLAWEVEQGAADEETEYRPVTMSSTDSLLASLLELTAAANGGETEVPRPREPLIVSLRAQYAERLQQAQIDALTGLTAAEGADQ